MADLTTLLSKFLTKLWDGTIYAAVLGGSTIGIPAIVARGRAVATSAAAATLINAYAVGAADGTFRVNATVTVTTAGSLNATMTVQFTDESNVSRTITLDWAIPGGTFPSALTTAVAYAGTSRVFRAKASTTITVATTGTFTGAVYNSEATLEQLATT